MQLDRIHRSVFGVVVFIFLDLRVSSATGIEELLRAQDANELAAHNDFSKWCHGTQARLTDRLAFEKERMNELTSAIGSYGEKVSKLRNTSKSTQPLDVLSQDQRLELIQTESQHWRNVHAKQAAEHLLKADQNLLEGVEAALQWEAQALSQHRTARQQLFTLVQEQHIQQSIQPHSTAVPEAASESLIPTASLHKSPPAPTRAFPQAQAQTRRHSESIAPIRPRASIARTIGEAISQLPMAAPVLGITQLPALQLMQRAWHPVPPPSPTPARHVKPPADNAAINPLLSLAGMSSRNTAQVTVLADISSQLTPAAVPTTPTATPVLAAVPAPPPAAPQVLPAVARAAKVELPALPVAPAAPATPVAAVAAPPPPAASKVETPALPVAPEVPAMPVPKAQASPVHASLASTVEMAMPSLPAPALDEPLASSSKPMSKQSSAAAPKSKAAQDPEEALMAIMTGDSAEAPSTAGSPGVEAPAAVPSKPKTTPPKAATAFLGARSERTTKKQVKEPAPLVTKDPEDALMDVMMQTGDDGLTQASVAKSGSLPRVPPQQRHARNVLAQTAQSVHLAPATVREPTKVVKSSSKQQPVADSEAGVMQSFIQEVTSLSQGEPGNSQADPATPVKEKDEGKDKQESEAHMMKSFVQEVTSLVHGEAPAEAPVTSAPTTESGLALSSDLASLMGLSAQGEPAPASFLQLSRGGQHRRSPSRSELAAALLIKDLDASEVSKRLARTVSQSSVESNVQMLTALNEQLQARQLQWSCTNGPAAARGMAVLQLAETGTSLLMGERNTVTSLSAELRDSQAESAQLKAEFVTMLEHTLGQSYEAAGTDLEALPLADLRKESPVGASALTALENILLADSAAAKQLGSKWVDQSAEYVRLEDELQQTSSAKDLELKKAQRVLSEARARAATTRSEVAKDAGCTDAARSSGLIAAVYKTLHILSD